MSLWEERAGRNEALFREVNERIAELGTDGEPASSAGFVCECSREDCTEQIQVPLAVYQTVRADSRRFLLRPGHEIDGLEVVVVERSAGYVVVEKDGVAGRIADRTDPRA